MVTPAELSALLREGENSGVEFKRDDIQPHDLAKALVALSNLRGGRIVLGVEDDGTISGLVRDPVDEWVLTVARDKVRPPLIPHIETVTDPGAGKQVAVVTVEAGYAVHAVTRCGTTGTSRTTSAPDGRAVRRAPRSFPACSSSAARSAPSSEFIMGEESLTVVLRR